MTRLPRICHHCDEPIEDPEDEVLVGAEPYNSAGGARLTYAHVDHVALLQPDPNLIPASVLVALHIGGLRRDR